MAAAEGALARLYRASNDSLNGPDSAEKKTHKSRVALSNATTRRQGAQGAQKGTRGVRGRPRVARWGRFCEGKPNGAARNAALR